MVSLGLVFVVILILYHCCYLLFVFGGLARGAALKPGRAYRVSGLGCGFFHSTPKQQRCENRQESDWQPRWRSSTHGANNPLGPKPLACKPRRKCSKLACRSLNCSP